MRTTWRGFVGRLGVGAAGLALLAFVFALGAGAAPVPSPKPDKQDDAKKDAAKKDEPKKAEDRQPGGLPVPDFPGALAPVPFGLESRPLLLNPAGHLGQGRLGISAQTPSATLAAQLDLPKGQGVVIEEVQPESAAAKAGLKAHDILLELNGKPVADNLADFTRQVQDVKADTPVEVVVLRKGKRETIKGLKLPEASDLVPALGNLVPPLPVLPLVPVVPNFPAAPLLPNLGGGLGVLVTTFRTNDRFTTRYQEGSLVLTVTGTVADGKAKVSGIEVQDVGKSDKYESVDKVPEQYRDKVTHLVEMSAKNSVRIEIKEP
jgi:membrane-associated protease RseP (regulator of RpoE activity)